MIDKPRYEWTRRYQNEWHLIRIYAVFLLRTECVAIAYQYQHGWRGRLCPTREHKDEVLFFEPTNLVDMKLLLQTTVALRESGDGA